ncbi:hypothetical protein ACIQ6Y_26405 [Streptomyces sp. NPDC096205]|uniref:hypothetical protein n=1 Tax=Streptomyces sp. NPDC096205 TaxID=3366081 RepID=UPI003808AD05
MTPSTFRGRPGPGRSHISVRVAHTVLGGAAGLVWLVLPTVPAGAGSDLAGPGTRAVAQGPEEDETATADLVLPLVAVGTAGALAAYGYVRRTRRARTPAVPARPAPGPAAPPPVAELEERCRRALIAADDSVRTSEEELGWAREQVGEEAVEPFARAVAEAREELTAAFRIRQRYDEGVPADPAERRHALAGIVGRCAEAGRRLDAESAGFDALRDLEGDGLPRALELAETRFRELAGRTVTAESMFAELAGRFPPSTRNPVTGYTEQAKDRLVFATTRLNQARQSADLGAPARAAAHLRAAESAIAQAAVFLDALHRLDTSLAEAAALVPDALTEAAEIGSDTASAEDAVDVPVGEVRARLLRLELVLTAVGEERAGGAYDPLDALRRIVRAVVPLGGGEDGVLGAAARLVAEESVADADAFVATHRGAVGAQARTRLAEARRLLGTGPEGRTDAEELARQARHLAEQDVRVHGHPLAGTDAPGSGQGGAHVGGVLLDDAPDDTPASFGGPAGRGRRTSAP